MKLAEIQTIYEIKPIEGADKIELARVQGWNSVVKRDEYKAGDRIVFIPIDTVLQPADWNSFLQSKNDPTASIRVKTVKLRGVVSSGLIFPLSILPENCRDLEVGTDVAEHLGVTKYVKPIPVQLQGYAKGDFPTHIVSKTDEDNLLSNVEVLGELKECDLLIGTLKGDGTSGTFIKELDGTFRVCSRNLELEDGENVYWRMARKYDLQNLMSEGMVLVGEIVGNGIQGNPMKLEDIELQIFNIKDLTDNSYLTYDDIRYTLEESNVPVVKEVCRFSGEEIKDLSLDKLQDIANKLEYTTNVPAEGIVIRGYKDGKLCYSNHLQKMLSVKVMNQNYTD